MEPALLALLILLSLLSPATPPTWLEKNTYMLYYTERYTAARLGGRLHTTHVYCYENYTIIDYNETHILIKYSVIDTNDTGVFFPEQGYSNTTWLNETPLVYSDSYNVSIPLYIQPGTTGNHVVINETREKDGEKTEVYAEILYDTETGILLRYNVSIKTTTNTTQLTIKTSSILVDTNLPINTYQPPPQPQESGEGEETTTKPPTETGPRPLDKNSETPNETGAGKNRGGDKEAGETSTWWPIAAAGAAAVLVILALLVLAGRHAEERGEVPGEIRGEAEEEDEGSLPSAQG